MFQDWENIPDFLISEYSLHKQALDYLRTINEMDDETALAFEIYSKQISYWPFNGYQLDDQLVKFRESYHGFFGGSMKDPTLQCAYQYVEESGLLSVFQRLSNVISITKLSRRIYFYMDTANMKVMFS